MKVGPLFFIAAVVLYSTGHWIGGTVLLVLALGSAD